MSKKHVLHLIDSAGLYGAERVILTLLEELRNSEYRGTIGCIRERETEIPAIAEEAQRIGIPVVYFTMRRGLNPVGISQIINFIKENDIRIVHSHGYKPNIFLGLAFNNKVKTVSTVHGWAKKAGGIKGKAYEFFDAQALKKFDSVVAVSKAVVQDLKNRGVSEGKIKLIYNGLKTKNDKQVYNVPDIRKKYGIDDNAFVIGSVGRLAKVKGHSYLVEAMPNILEQIEYCQLLIAGEGPERAHLESLIRKYKLRDRVKLPGYIENIDQFLAAIDLFVLPSLTEGLPLVLLEAMAAGKPVVATAAGGILEVVETSDIGFLVPPADPSSLAESIKGIYRSKERMSNMVLRAKSIVRTKYSSDMMARQYLAIYSQLLTN